MYLLMSVTIMQYVAIVMVHTTAPVTLDMQEMERFAQVLVPEISNLQLNFCFKFFLSNQNLCCDKKERIIVP